MTPSLDVRIVPATEKDTPVIVSLIKGLADYERLAHEVEATEEGIHESLFGDWPAAEVVLAYVGSDVAGFALFFHNFSTFLGRRGLYLEDLFVLPAYRVAESAGASCPISPASRSNAAVAGWSGGCSIGMRPRSDSTRASVPGRWTIGRCTGSTGTHWRGWPT